MTLSHKSTCRIRLQEWTTLRELLLRWWLYGCGRETVYCLVQLGYTYTFVRKYKFTVSWGSQISRTALGGTHRLLVVLMLHSGSSNVTDRYRWCKLSNTRDPRAPYHRDVRFTARWRYLRDIYIAVCCYFIAAIPHESDVRILYFIMDSIMYYAEWPYVLWTMYDMSWLIHIIDTKDASGIEIHTSWFRNIFKVLIIYSIAAKFRSVVRWFFFFINS